MPLIGDDPRSSHSNAFQSVVQDSSDPNPGISEAVDVLQGMLDCIREKMWVKPLSIKWRGARRTAQDGELDRWHGESGTTSVGDRGEP